MNNSTFERMLIGGFLDDIKELLYRAGFSEIKNGKHDGPISVFHNNRDLWKGETPTIFVILRNKWVRLEHREGYQVISARVTDL